jgi:hypothetical protein
MCNSGVEKEGKEKELPKGRVCEVGMDIDDLRSERETGDGK